MGTAVAVGAVGVHALERSGHGEARRQAAAARRHRRRGRCSSAPASRSSATARARRLAAVGEGRRDALAGVLGMLAGAAPSSRLYPTLKPPLEAGDQGKVTLPEATGTPAWPWVAGLAAVVTGRAAPELAQGRTPEEEP